MTPMLLALALVGCQLDDEPLDPPIGEFIEDAYTVQGFEAVGNVGNVPVDTVVRAVNQFGASIPSEPQGILVGGSSQTVPFDALGYGRVRVETAGVVSVDDGGQVVEVTAFDSGWPGFGVSRAAESVGLGATLAQPLDTGTVVVIGRELYFVGPEGPPHRVLNADAAIKGMQAGHINVDGIQDLVVWTENQVYLMRGRLNGGLAFGAAITASRHRVGGAAIGELSDDNLPDLVIAWSANEGPSKLDEWHGNGLFGFRAAEPRNLPAIPISVSIGDTTGETLRGGKNQITVLSEDGTWARFIAGSPDRYMPIGPRTPDEVSIPLGSTVEAWGDINGDGGEEMWFLGPLNPDSVRKIVIVDLVGNKIEFLPLNPMAAYVSRADLDGNGLVDHIELHNSNSLRSLSFDETSSNSYTPRLVEDLPDYGPMIMSDIVDQDGIPDLFVAGPDIWWWWRGFNNPTDSDVYWQIGEQALGEAGTTIGPIHVAELDGNGNTTEVIGFEDQGGSTTLTIWAWNTVSQTGSVLGSTVVSVTGVDPVDLSLCGASAWVLLEGQAVRVNVADPALPFVAATTNTTATAIDCGDAPGGGRGAILEGGTVEVLDNALLTLSTLATPGGQDVAIGDIGNGPEVRTCDVSGCSIVYWPEGGASGAFATGTDNQISLDDGGSQVLSGSGAVSVYDVDLDGNTDLLAAAADGLITLHRSVGDGPSMPELFHTRNLPVGPVAAGDADGDGFPDLWLRDGDDRLLHSTAPRRAGAGTGTTTP